MKVTRLNVSPYLYRCLKKHVRKVCAQYSLTHNYTLILLLVTFSIAHYIQVKLVCKYVLLSRHKIHFR